jgi:carbohydrate-selective porin OprB
VNIRPAGALAVLLALLPWRPAVAEPVTADLIYDGALWGVLRGQSAPALSWQDQAQLDLGVELLPQTTSQPSSLRAVASVRWRDPDSDRDPGTLIGSSALFDPSDWGSGTGVRLMQLGLAFQSGEFSALAGWIQPQPQFLQQPLSKLVQNHAVLSAKGVGGNIPFVSSFTTWGGVISWTPRSGDRLQAGVFMTYPGATLSSNNGVWFGGNPSQPGTNRLMGLLEGRRPIRLGGGRLPGVVAIGGYVYDGAGQVQPSTANGGTQAGGYLQFDQALWIERASSPTAQASGRRLDAFSVLAFAPAANNAYPAYGHLGLAFTGPFASRPRDLLVSTVALGTYSANTPGPPASSSLIAELGYQLSLSRAGHLALYPFAQLVIRPDGTTSVPNAFLAGVAVRVAF